MGLRIIGVAVLLVVIAAGLTWLSERVRIVPPSTPSRPPADESERGENL